MGYYDKLNKGCKLIKLRTAIKKLKEGKTIRVAEWGRTLFRMRNNNTEVWMLYPGCYWNKLGTLKDFRTSEYDRNFIEV
jgi:hypothetical protein